MKHLVRLYKRAKHRRALRRFRALLDSYRATGLIRNTIVLYGERFNYEDGWIVAPDGTKLEKYEGTN